ncbi:class I SAM-dependent methyltransferase [Gramella jeungdoensis]|uniref:Class I SAM-dependent methyltransferase n=2 Tax=Flavobacteriaceae TaxID=49546 RepID=A0A4Y8APA2_9FLAO|nr:class I SAM-dependent methyltransferase [Gramella jeungdoensis]
MECKLCNSKTTLFYSIKYIDYYKCSACFAVLMDPNCYPSINNEKKRYLEHNNNVHDLGYQKFVDPIVKAVKKDFNNTATGLDFGCGTGPVITKLLRDKNYSITTYDPFFDNNLNALETNYNFIVCCEVIEHFHNPLQEFKRLKNLLKPQGRLYCMTDLFSENINFKNWYYKEDNTHVIFYHKNTFNWIQKNVGFSKVTMNNRLITFEI